MGTEKSGRPKGRRSLLKNPLNGYSWQNQPAWTFKGASMGLFIANDWQQGFTGGLPGMRFPQKNAPFAHGGVVGVMPGETPWPQRRKLARLRSPKGSRAAGRDASAYSWHTQPRRTPLGGTKPQFKTLIIL